MTQNTSPQGKRPRHAVERRQQRRAAHGSAAGTRPGAAGASCRPRSSARWPKSAACRLQPALVKDFLGMVQRRDRLGPEMEARTSELHGRALFDNDCPSLSSTTTRLRRRRRAPTPNKESHPRVRVSCARRWSVRCGDEAVRCGKEVFYSTACARLLQYGFWVSASPSRKLFL